MSVCLSTALYEKTYQHYIDNDKLRDWLKKLNYKFDEIIIMFNNISDEGYQKCLEYISQIDKNILHYRSADQTEEIIKTFKLNPHYQYSQEYYYSIANFSQIILSQSEYLMYICEDISLVNDCSKFVPQSIEVINNRQDCMGTGMNWTSPGYGPGYGDQPDGDSPKREEDAAEHSFGIPLIRDENFRLTDSFGDHVYMISKKRAMETDYNTKHPVPSSRFPGYSGESFDKRINHYMHNNKLYRFVSKKCYYAHVGWPYYLKDETF